MIKAFKCDLLHSILEAWLRAAPHNCYTQGALLPEYQSDSKIPSVYLL
jgi:hypothetical protein